MTRWVLFSALAIALTTGTFCSAVERGQPDGAVAASSTAAQDAQERFVIKFCYSQYRGQDDIMRCLARGT
jgi:hypothetical protein